MQTSLTSGLPLGTLHSKWNAIHTHTQLVLPLVVLADMQGSLAHQPGQIPEFGKPIQTGALCSLSQHLI